jgi:hypothetical protein
MLHRPEKTETPEQIDTAEQMGKNMRILKEAQERILEGFAPLQRNEIRLTDAELKDAFRRANRFSGPVQKSFMISNPPPEFEEMLPSFIAQSTACKIERVSTPAELSDEGRRQVLELSKKIREGLKGIVNVTEKQFKIDNELLGEPIKGGSGLRWSSRSYTIDFDVMNKNRSFRVYWMSESDTYLRGREGWYNAEGRLVLFSDSYKKYISIEPTQKELLFKLQGEILNGLVALGAVDKNKRTLNMDELQKIHRKLADDKTKKLKLKELSKLPQISDDILAASNFVNSAVTMSNDIQRAKRLEAGIVELSSNPDVQLCRKKYEKESSI